MSLWFSYNLCLLSGFWLYGFFNKTYKFQRLFNALIERIWTWRSLVFYTLLNHDKMTFRERAKVSFFLTLSCSEAISISNMHWKSISDFQNNALIDLKQPRLTFNRKIFFVRYLFSITVSVIVIMFIVFLAFSCSPCQSNPLHVSSAFFRTEHIFRLPKNH